jgi:hypothetical protein
MFNTIENIELGVDFNVDLNDEDADEYEEFETELIKSKYEVHIGQQMVEQSLSESWVIPRPCAWDSRNSTEIDYMLGDTLELDLDDVYENFLG